MLTSVEIDLTIKFLFICVLHIELFYFLLFTFSILAKLDKADRALCFTSGMAALAAVAHLVGTGTFQIRQNLNLMIFFSY